MKRFIVAVSLSLVASLADASQTWIVIGDSIMSDIYATPASASTVHLLQAERDVMIRNISSPGAALGKADASGYNEPGVVDTISRIGGLFGWYNGVIIQAGTNDFGRNVHWGDTVTAMRRILDKIRLDNKRAIVLDPIYRDGETVANALGYNLDTYRYFMFLVCATEYPDVCHFAHRAHTDMGSFNNNYASSEVASGMRLHPNAAGHRKLANWIKAEAATAGFF